jgi:UV DNA damage endonuclease
MKDIRWGLCCVFADEPIRYRTVTHAYIARQPDARLSRLRAIADHNISALQDSIAACSRLGIGAFRVNSQFLPLATHPSSGYTMEELDPDGSMRGRLDEVRQQADAAGVRRSFHPDQFLVLNSLRDDVVESSIREFEWQSLMAELIGADVVLIHGGSGGGGTEAALARLAGAIDRLSDRSRRLLALENDDRVFAPAALLPFCHAEGIPFVYDIHHHRCLPDGVDDAAATDLAMATWGDREPYFHISSPRDGWDAKNPRTHADYIEPCDVPAAWRGLRLTVDVEARAKERAILRLMRDLDS